MSKFRLFATLLVVALCATTIFTSCRNDDDDNGGTFEIRATNVSGNTGRIVTVKAETYEEWLTVGEAPFQNNGFTLRLINEVPTSFLYPIDDKGEGFTISDRSARYVETGLFAYDRDGNIIGSFSFINERENETFEARWIYVDRDVTITGTRYGTTYNLNLRRGWNTYYSYWNESTNASRHTTQRPSGANLRWYFED